MFICSMKQVPLKLSAVTPSFFWYLSHWNLLEFYLMQKYQKYEMYVQIGIIYTNTSLEM